MSAFKIGNPGCCCASPSRDFCVRVQGCSADKAGLSVAFKVNGTTAATVSTDANGKACANLTILSGDTLTATVGSPPTGFVATTITWGHSGSTWTNGSPGSLTLTVATGYSCTNHVSGWCCDYGTATPPFKTNCASNPTLFPVLNGNKPATYAFSGGAYVFTFGFNPDQTGNCNCPTANTGLSPLQAWNFRLTCSGGVWTLSYNVTFLRTNCFTGGTIPIPGAVLTATNAADCGQCLVSLTFSIPAYTFTFGDSVQCTSQAMTLSVTT